MSLNYLKEAVKADDTEKFETWAQARREGKLIEDEMNKAE